MEYRHIIVDISVAIVYNDEKKKLTRSSVRYEIINAEASFGYIIIILGGFQIKKKVVAILFTVMMVSAVACPVFAEESAAETTVVTENSEGESEENSEKAARIQEIKEQIAALEEELKELEGNEGSVDEDVSLGTVVTEEGVAEITIKNVSYQTQITPSDTSGVYNYYETQNSDNVFLACNFDFTNLKTEAGTSLDDFITFQVTYDGGYTYTGWTVAEENDYLSTYPNLLPLSTYNCWAAIEVPSKLQGTAYELTFAMNNVTHKIITE